MGEFCSKRREAGPEPAEGSQYTLHAGGWGVTGEGDWDRVSEWVEAEGGWWHWCWREGEDVWEWWQWEPPGWPDHWGVMRWEPWGAWHGAWVADRIVEPQRRIPRWAIARGQ